MDCKIENAKLIAHGEKLRTKYLYNIYNDTDLTKFFEILHSKNNKVIKKINKIII